MQRHSPNMRTAAGFTIVELMVAMAISLLLLTGVVAIFSSSRVSYESTNQLSRVQETGRFALDLLSRHVRASGYAGCSRAPNFIGTSLNSSDLVQWNFLGGPVQGFDATGSTWVPTFDPTYVVNAHPESDVLVVRGPRLGAVPTTLTGSMLTRTDALPVSSTAGAGASGSVMMAYSCEGVSVFFGTAAGTTLLHPESGSVPGNDIPELSYPFRRNAEVVPVESVVYFVGESSATAPPLTRSLYRRVGMGLTEELVQGVEQMQVEYGLDTTDDRVVDSYTAATDTTNWQQVIAVRIALLVRSVEEYGNDRDTRSYQVLSTAVPAANDRRLREVFTSTVSIRNRTSVE